MSFRPYEKPLAIFSSPSDLPTQVPLPIPGYVAVLQGLSLTRNPDLLQEILKEVETQDTVPASPPTWTIRDLDAPPSTDFSSTEDGQPELQPVDYMECGPVPESQRKISRVLFQGQLQRVLDDFQGQLQRVLDDGTVNNVEMVYEGAVQALIQNGFKESNPSNEEPTLHIPEVEAPPHVIQVPSRYAGILEGWDVHTLASFLQPSPEMVLAARIILDNRRRTETTVEEYHQALAANPSMNPMLRSHHEPIRKIQKHSKKPLRARGRFPHTTKESVLDKMIRDADSKKKNIVEQIAAANFTSHIPDGATYF